jgi:uncharacterized membrane protein YbhN (UPF0104 family)
LNNRKFIIQVCKGLIRHHRARRMLMFYSVLIAIVLAFAGATLLWPLLREHPFLFLGYWAACVWITFLAVLLAFYDLMKVREECRLERQRLRAEYLESIKNAPPSPSAPHQPLPSESSVPSDRPGFLDGTGTSEKRK